MTHEI
jgi:hypothetical protein